MNKDLKQNSFLFGSNAVFLEELHRLYLSDPKLVDQTWRDYFQNIEDGNVQQKTTKSTSTVITSVQMNQNHEIALESSDAVNTLKARNMIEAYRKYGHLLVKLDPLNLEVVKTKSELRLNIEDFGFVSSQMNTVLGISNEFFGINTCTLRELIDLLDRTYAYDIGVEFDHVANEEEKSWFFSQVEKGVNSLNSSADDKKNLLRDLVEIEGFEQYLHTKFPGAKRFSVEGGDTAVVAIDRAIDMSIMHGVEDIVIGMAHRGRLNTLAKVMGKPYKAIIAGFITGSVMPDNLGISGDVKYHIGYSSDRVRGASKVHLSMAYNPSHLEAVNPVVAGKVRAKQDIIKDVSRKKVMGILVHGDSAFCGQGVVAEGLSMSDLEAYNIGGIVHFVINNQVGFTANSGATRSSRYSTEFAKIINSPILHVNGDNVEAVIRATNIAVNYKHKFGRDVVVEIVCYRKYGHNEGDEPMYTQGVMYSVIKQKQSPATLYANSLLASSVIDQNHLTSVKEQFKSKLDGEYEQAKTYQPKAQFLEGLWSGYTRSVDKILSTGVNINTLKELGIKLCQVPKDFALNPKLEKLFESRKETLKQNKPIDWATAELLAYASLLSSGTPIRFTGQDSGRGTFSHRHAVLHSQVDDSTYIPLNNLSKSQANLEIADSNLSEYAVLGFEYGYSLVSPQNLVIWEAQFGDFSNGAQIMFDQFISSSESKWLRMSGLVVLLPHGFEGQGPEHSSARLERFLQLSAEDNIQVAYPTTPASFFHLLRRQLYSNTRKPLIVMSPKSLLRHRMVVSDLDQFSENTKFIPIIDEIDSAIDPKSVKHVVICSGKVYYDLLEKRAEKKIIDVAIIRFEQLYPFEEDIIIKILGRYNKVEDFIWCQEEPKNMGAWNFIQDRLNDSLKGASISNKFRYVGRVESASPAVGSLHQHNQQQEQLVKEALNIKE
jgi:2-oxoglutarate dehydrogenase E1 component